ncbi:MAG: nuclear transport factor 2 family protein [Chitinophagaceae bacterium]|nr:nuclear transport factor 2 family protein [Chitinophagaceae bacterium]
MKKCLSLLILLMAVTSLYAQPAGLSDKKQIENVLQSFMDCIEKKDTTRFLQLFYSGPVQWVGTIKPASYASELKEDPKANDFFTGNQRAFIRSVSGKDNCAERFYNIHIHEDGSVAMVTFDYSFWKNGEKQNWGQESWGLIKTKGQWKITSVIFSIEMENVLSEPAR